VIAVERLNSDSSDDKPQRPCVSLTMEASEATVQQFYPGAFVYLSVPSISRVSHPFTVNRVSGQTKQIRVIFRVTGPFTRALEKNLFFRSVTTTPLMGDREEDDVEEFQNRRSNIEYCPSISFPRLYLDGYYGSANLRGQIFSHDLCVVIAAGIGITPYLSLLPELFLSSSKITHNIPYDGLMIKDNQSGSVRQPRQIILHWICRDRSLIDFCEKEYMKFSSEYLHESKAEGESYSVRIIIHYTGGVDLKLDESRMSANLRQNDIIDTAQHEGVPFELSYFSVNGKTIDNLWNIIIFSFLSWGGLWCLWRWFKKQEKTEYIHRIYTLAAIMVYGLITGILVNIFRHLYLKRKAQSFTTGFNGGGGDSITKFNEMELSTYGDRTFPCRARSVRVVPAENANHISPVTIEVMEGRPLVDNIIEDLNVEDSPALFCCVPENLARNLKKAINRKSRFDDRYNAIPLYQESFEK